MKKVILLSILLGTVGFGLSQNRNNIWEISPGTNIYPITNEINFNQGFADTLGIIRSMDFFITDASICDTSGQLLFYTNGQYIGNRNHDSLFNCSNFNPGYATNVYYSNGLGLFQAAIVLPYPDNTLQYTIFHISFEHFSNQNGNLVYEPVKLYYTVVDMSLDGGLGGVTNQKNVVLINDTLINGHITSCKHGNGRDWWTLIQKYNSNTFYKILLTSNGIQQITTQTIGTSQPELNDYYGQAVFSPDGFKYANLIGTKDTLDLYDFNRCDGTLSNLQNITVPDTGSLSAGLGCSFSPDSRFLYVSSYKRLYQYDTWAVNVNSSGILIAQYDSFFSPFQTLFNMHQIGSDGKIYISTWNGNNVMHVINTPDSLGLNCNFIQHSFILPTYNTTIPNFPNYDLGTWIGSSCDTLTAINETSKSNLNLKIFPNPASNYFYANYNLPSNSSAQLTIYNMFGQKISTHNLYGTFKTLMVHTEDLQNGIYIITVKSNKEELSVGRINIIK